MRKILGVMLTLVLMLSMALAIPTPVAAAGSWSDDFNNNTADQTWTNISAYSHDGSVAISDNSYVLSANYDTTDGAYISYVAGTSGTDYTIQTKIVSGSANYQAYVLAKFDAVNGYAYTLGISTDGQVKIGIIVGWSIQTIASTSSISFDPDNCYIKFSVGSELKGKVWNVGTTEPTDWQVSNPGYPNDPRYASGAGGVMAVTTNSSNAQVAFDDVSLMLAGDLGGEYEVGGPPEVTVNFLNGYSEPIENMNPQVAQTVKVNVNVGEGRTLAELTEVKFKIWYDSGANYGSGGSYPTIEEFSALTDGDTQTCAIITWTPGGGFLLDSQASGQTSTTWVLGSCTTPTLTNSSGDFTLVFTPGKVATATTGNDAWQMAATATSGTYGTGYGVDGDGTSNFFGVQMNWYGQIVLSAATIDWGVVPAGLDFGDDTASEEAIGSTITIICNGAYVIKAKSSASWAGIGNTANLTTDTLTNQPQQFSLKADDTGTLASAALLDTIGVIIATGGSITGEAGSDPITDATLWLKLSSTFIADIYTGTVTFMVTSQAA